MGQNYEQKIIGEGSFGKVFRIEKNSEVYALKECPQDKETTQNEFEIVQKIMTHKIQSLHIVFFHMIYQKKNKNYYLMENMSQGDFQQVLDSQIMIGDKKLLKCLAYQLLDGLSHIHECYGFAHGDFGPKNILMRKINNEFFFKLADFGSAVMTENFSISTKIGILILFICLPALIL